MKALCYGNGSLPDKEQSFLRPHLHINTGSLLKIESSNFGGDDVMVYVFSWRRISRVQSLAQVYRSQNVHYLTLQWLCKHLAY
jgi:hypothetical protein